MCNQEKAFSIRAATEEEDEILAAYYLHMWREIGVPQAEITATAILDTKTFIRGARLNLDFKGLIAKSNDLTVGAACCQKFACAYPIVTANVLSKRGYIWGVYVEPRFRQRGVARQLVGHCVDHLVSVGCEAVVLHASDAGRGLYERMGFRATNEMSIRQEDLG